MHLSLISGTATFQKLGVFILSRPSLSRGPTTLSQLEDLAERRARTPDKRFRCILR